MLTSTILKWCLVSTFCLTLFLQPNVQAYTYKSSSYLFQRRSDFAGSSIDNVAVLAGGSVNSLYPATYSSVADIYDFTTNQITSDQMALCEPRAYLASTSCSSKIFFAGGLTNGGSRSTVSSAVDIYDVQTKRWTSNRSQLSGSRAYMSASCTNGYAVFAGGITLAGVFSLQTVSRVDMYHLPTNSWSSSSTALSQPRYLMASGSTPTKLLFAGGSTKGSLLSFYSCTSVVDVFDTQTKTWSVDPTGLSTSRCSMASASVGHLVLFAGGVYSSPNSTIYSTVVDLYNGETNSWTSYTNGLSQARSDLAGAVAGSYVIFAGGYSSGNKMVTYFRTMDFYNYKTERWSVKPYGLSTPRAYLVGVGANSLGSVSLFAGGLSYNSERSSSIDIHVNGPIVQSTFSVVCSTVGNRTTSNQTEQSSFTFTAVQMDMNHIDTRCTQCTDWFCTISSEQTLQQFMYSTYVCAKDGSIFVDATYKTRDGRTVEQSVAVQPQTERGMTTTTFELMNKDKCSFTTSIQTNV